MMAFIYNNDCGMVKMNFQKDVLFSIMCALLLSSCASSPHGALCRPSASDLHDPDFPETSCYWEPAHEIQDVCKADIDGGVTVAFLPAETRYFAKKALWRLSTPEGREFVRKREEQDRETLRSIGKAMPETPDAYGLDGPEEHAQEIERLKRLIALNDDYYRSLDLAAVAAWFQTRAERGHARAETCLGLMHEFGVGFPKSRAKAANHYKRASEKDDPVALYYLARLYVLGKGVGKKDPGKALALFERSASLGYRAAADYVGFFHRMGLGVEKNPERALNWTRLAARAGYPNAQFVLAQHLERGDAVARDFGRAAYWYGLAGKGMPLARYGYCELWEMSQGVARDDPRARQWCQTSKAAPVQNAR